MNERFVDTEGRCWACRITFQYDALHVPAVPLDRPIEVVYGESSQEARGVLCAPCVFFRINPARAARGLPTWEWEAGVYGDVIGYPEGDKSERTA